MQGLAIGAIFGALALYFLTISAKAVTSGNTLSALLPFLGNIGSISAGLALAVVFFRNQLAQAGAGMAAVLVLGAFALFLWRGAKRK